MIATAEQPLGKDKFRFVPKLSVTGGVLYRGMLMLGALLVVCISSAAAQTDIYIRGSGRLVPIAIALPCNQGAAATAGQDVQKIISRDLDLSGYFEVLDPGGYIETPGKCGSQEGVAYSDWSVLRTEGLVRGVITPSGAGMVTVQMYLHDVQRQRVVMGKEYQGDVSKISLIAHRFANEVIKYFTGELGPFGSSIVYSSRIGRFKELFVMDADGMNPRQLTDEKALAISASWHPFGSSVVYTSYRSRVPNLFTVNPISRQTTQITRTPNLELGAEYFGDGKELVVALTDGHSTDLVVMDTAGRIIRKLTRSDGTINVSPSLAPDDSKIAFCSNRAGGPQIYTMNSDGTEVKRVSFVTSNYCTSPVWSPKGDHIAFVCRAERGFHVFVSNPDGTDAVQLTSAGDNEDPSWSPDGRYLVFSSTFGRGGVPNLALARIDGGPIRQLTNSRGGDYQPDWGPYIN